MTEELIAFIRAQLDDDERVAREAAAGERDPFDGSGVIVMPVHGGMTRSVTLTSSVAAHIARWDPARVLALTDALRRALDDFHGEAREYEVIVLLARALYADRPGFPEQWQA